jgi:hypothetical protein
MQPIETDARLPRMPATPPHAACGCCTPTTHRLHRREHSAQARALPNAHATPAVAAVKCESKPGLSPELRRYLAIYVALIIGVSLLAKACG